MEGWFNRHKFLGIFLIIIGSIILVSILIGLFVPQEKTPEKNTDIQLVGNEPSNTGSQSSEEQPVKQSTKVVTIGELYLSAKSWDADSTIDGLEFYLDPKDSEDRTIETDGTINIKLWKLECTEENEYIGCVKRACTKKSSDLIETWSIPIKEDEFEFLMGIKVRAEYKSYTPLTSGASFDKLTEEQGCAEIILVTPDNKQFSSLADSILLSGY